MAILLGPPEIYTSSTDPPPLESGVTNSFMELMVKNFNTAGDDFLGKPATGKTKNKSPTYLSSGNACLDFFFHVVPGTTVKDSNDYHSPWHHRNPLITDHTINDMLELSWDQNPLTTVKLICNLRGDGGTGKSDKEGFYASALWLHRVHPKSLACNLEEMAKFVSFKDFLEILYRVLEGADVRENQKAGRKREREERQKMKYISLGGKTKNKRKRPMKEQLTEAQKEARNLMIQKRVDDEKEAAKYRKEERRIEKAKKLIDRYKHDPDYRYLHDRVSDLFSEFLKKDLESFKQGSPNLSQAAKWCPSLDSSFDRTTLLCETIARKTFPKEDDPEYQDIDDAHYVYRVRDRLRKEVLVPLRKALKTPEDREPFPHKIIKALGAEDGGVDADSRWKTLVKEMSSKGKLKNCLAICDVSSSMEGIPLEACLALGLLVSELSEEPWKGKLITFSKKPQLHTIKGDNLGSKVDFVKNTKLKKNKDLQRVVDMILEVAEKGNMKEDEMIKRLFVFSDMEFDKTPSFSKQSDYEAIERKFREKGYGNCMPEIVFWNLKHSESTPVLGNQKGVALVGGYSKNMLEMFLERDVVSNPLAIMESAISGAEYRNLVAFD